MAREWQIAGGGRRRVATGQGLARVVEGHAERRAGASGDGRDAMAQADAVVALRALVGPLARREQLGSDLIAEIEQVRHENAQPATALILELTETNLLQNGQEWAFARLITDLATTLGLITVAEGIEVAGQHDRLAGLGCMHGQGHLYSRPTDVERIDALLTANSARGLRLRAA